MPIKKAAGAVIFYKGPANKIEYLLLKHTERYWNFPKGAIEKGEREIDAAAREVFEETSLKDINIVPGFKAREKYFLRSAKGFPKKEYPNKAVLKLVTFYLAESKTKNVKISHEHKGFEWLSLNDALARFRKHKSHSQGEKTLIKANDFILSKENLCNR